MFRIVMTAAWAVLLIVVLYLWADVREIRSVVKDTKRELLRSNLSARASESFPNFEKEAREKEVRRAAGGSAVVVSQELREKPESSGRAGLERRADRIPGVMAGERDGQGLLTEQQL